MRKTFSLLIIIALPALLSAQVYQPLISRPLVFRNVTVIDVQSGQAHRDMTVVIVGNRIAGLGKKVKVPMNAEVVEASGQFMIPGLWDMHVHLFNNASRAGTNNKDSYFPLLIVNGVTGVRDMWTDADDLKRARVANGNGDGQNARAAHRRRERYC